MGPLKRKRGGPDTVAFAFADSHVDLLSANAGGDEVSKEDDEKPSHSYRPEPHAVPTNKGLWTRRHLIAITLHDSPWLESR
jgi:hypothetical protein